MACLVSYLPLFSLLSSELRLSLSLTYLYGMHQVVLAHSYFYWVKCHPSRTFLLKKFERESQNKPLFLLTAGPHLLTRGPTLMYWLGTSRWCLGPLCMLYFRLNLFLSSLHAIPVAFVFVWFYCTLWRVFNFCGVKDIWAFGLMPLAFSLLP